MKFACKVLCSLLGGISISSASIAQQEWPCTWGDLACLLREGEIRLRQRHPEEAYLFFEQAAFIAPDDPVVRHSMGATLLQLGATQAAAELLPGEASASAPTQRLELALGYSDNRNQLPSLSEIRLTLPGLPTSRTPLEKPLKPDAGPVYWLNYTRRGSDGELIQLGSNASPDNRLGLLWGRIEHPVDEQRQWQLRGEYYQRLEDGWQALLALRRRAHLGAGVIGDAEAAIREESVVGNYHFLELRLGAYRETTLGSFGLGIQRSTPLGEQPPGGGQWRYSLLWGTQGRWQATQWSIAFLQRYSQDDDPYHPFLANGQARWQIGSLLTCGLEHPLGQGWAAWGRIAMERQRSNVEFFTTRRNEGLLGLAYHW